ncbi:g11255 [Coccomyxa viridis]|uniref:G11255 protein n=1 Tax=Coccomyxa viridis TaxID=1274662 RepID=A0ABP1GC80_9CHLO
MALPSPGWAARQLELLDKEIADLNDSYQTAMKSLSESPQCRIMVEIYQHSRERLMRSMTARRDFCLALSNAGLLAQGSCGDPPMWDSGYSTNELNRFVKALPAQKVAILKLRPGSVISLTEGAAWLGDPFIATNNVFVRQAYPQLLRAREARFRARKVSTSSSETVFTGSPGAAGLSHFAGAFMGMQLLMGREVLFECRGGRPRTPTRHFYWLSSSSGFAHTKDQKVALEKLMKSKSQPIYIVDNCPAGIDRKCWLGKP